MQISRTPAIAVTGLNATDNPAPGVAVLRSLREAKVAERLVGLAYDALDPGIYAADIVDDVFMLPYPSSSSDVYLERLREVHQKVGFTAIVPTLDAEMPTFIELAPTLRQMGIATLLPSRAQFDARSKANLQKLARRAGFRTPETMLVTSLAQLAEAERTLRYPLFVKGPFYGAKLATNVEEARIAFQSIVAEWGFPIIVQACVSGAEREERNVVALGDGKGGTIGAVAMKKLAVTDKGKGWAGITIRDPSLLALTERFVRATEWRGPFELEVVVASDGTYYVIEINPRFPAWVYLATRAGVNLPLAAISLATDGAGASLPVFGDYAVGTVFVRITLDQIASVADLERMVVMGEWRRNA